MTGSIHCFNSIKSDAALLFRRIDEVVFGFLEGVWGGGAMRSHWLLDPALSRTVHIKGMRKRWVAIANIRMFTSCRPICQLVRSSAAAT